MSLNNLSKKQAQYIGYVVFLLIYIGLSLSWMVPMGYKMLVYLPSAFFVGIIGYWLGGFLHKRLT